MKNTPRFGLHCAALAVISLVNAGCVRSISNRITSPLAKMIRNRKTSRPTVVHAAARKTTRPDDLVRQTMQRQTEGAYDPVTGDRNVADLQTRLRLNPRDFDARLQLAAIYERYSLSDLALEQYSQALGVTDTAANETADVGPSPRLTLPQAETAATGLARSSRAAGRAADAVAVLAGFVKQWPTASVWSELGLLYDETAERASAERAFRQALLREPNSAEHHSNLGYNLLLQGKTESAETEFRRALELNPKMATAHNNLGLVLARRGETAAAYEQFREGSPDAATAHNNLAVVLLEMGYLERSREELVKALAARYYFAAPMENFKLVQGLLRQRAELLAATRGLPLSAIHIASSLALAAAPVVPPVAQSADPVSLTDPQTRRASERDAGHDSTFSEDRK